MQRVLGAATLLLVLAIGFGARADTVEADIVRMTQAFCDAGGAGAAFAIAAAEREGFGPPRPQDRDLLLPMDGVSSPQIRVKMSADRRFAVFTGDHDTTAGPTQVCAVVVFPHTAAPDINAAAGRWLGMAPVNSDEVSGSYAFAAGADGRRTAIAGLAPAAVRAAFEQGRVRVVVAYSSSDGDVSGLMYMAARPQSANGD